jgi:hypothetical protein
MKAFRVTLQSEHGEYVRRLFDSEANAQAFIAYMSECGWRQYGNVTAGQIHVAGDGAMWLRMSDGERKFDVPLHTK